MHSIYEKNKDKFENSFNKIKEVYLHKNNEIPFFITDTNYWLSGENAETIPKDYFTSYESMTKYQINNILYHLKNYDDAYIPLLFPWYGTGVIPSALGCDIIFRENDDPAVQGTVIKDLHDIKKLQFPNPYKDGLMPNVLECIDYMKAHSDLPISFTDPQGPLNIAICLCGVENLFMWMYDYPNKVHEIMEFAAEVFIEWIKVQKRHIGDLGQIGGFPHGMCLPKTFGEVWLCDDDCTILSPDLYKEFVVPYNSKIFKAFNGGTLHFCGSAKHQIENFLQTDGLVGINNFCMGDFEQIVKMQEAFEDQLALMVCDFTPLHIESYYKKLFSILKVKGTMLGTFIAPEFALIDGKYDKTYRDKHITGDYCFKMIQQELKNLR